MFKTILGGLGASAIGIHCIENKKLKDKLSNFCPFTDKKNKDSKKKKD